MHWGTVGTRIIGVHASPRPLTPLSFVFISRFTRLHLSAPCAAPYSSLPLPSFLFSFAAGQLERVAFTLSEELDQPTIEYSAPQREDFVLVPCSVQFYLLMQRKLKEGQNHVPATVTLFTRDSSYTAAFTYVVGA